jgi:hypothetical protein
MAKLMLVGDMAQVELLSDPIEGGTIATCAGHTRPNVLDSRLDHECSWTERYDTLDDAGEYAASHADSGR